MVFICISASNLLDSEFVQETSINLCLKESVVGFAFAQSALCIATPLPLVIYPIISSPGSGLQHLANLISILSNPLTTIP